MQKNLCTELEQNWRSEKSDVCKESFLLDYLPEGDMTVRENGNYRWAGVREVQNW